jgi:hypothetical protein
MVLESGTGDSGAGQWAPGAVGSSAFQMSWKPSTDLELLNTTRDTECE